MGRNKIDERTMLEKWQREMVRSNLDANLTTKKFRINTDKKQFLKEMVTTKQQRKMQSNKGR